MEAMARIALGIDIGGTKIRGVVFDGEKVLRREDRRYVRKPPGRKEFLEALFGVIEALRAQTPQKIMQIGIGTAGVVAGSRVFPGPNLSIVGRLNLPAILRRRYGASVRLANDVKTSALAEWHFGAARKAHSIVMITLGSGLGGAYIKNGVLQQGAFSSAYEMGFLIIDAERSRQGKRGDFEWFGSEKFFISRGLNPIEAEQKARRGNARMRRLWRDYGEYLGIGAAGIINVLEPEIFVVGGGIAHAWPLFAPSMRKIARRLILSPLARRHTKIVRTKLGRDAGAIGAALLIHTAVQQRLELHYTESRPFKTPCIPRTL